MSYENVNDLLRTFNEQEFFGGVDIDEVKAVERSLKIDSPSDYVEYLLNLGCGFAASEDFFGLGGSDNLNLVNRLKFLKKPSTHRKFPSYLIPLKPDGYGNYDCIDLNQSSEDESVIVFWTHDGSSSQPSEVIEKGIWKWFYNELVLLKEFDEQ